MAGQLHINSFRESAQVGTPVIIHVGATNSPTGIWRGRIVHLGDKIGAAIDSSFMRHCDVRIDDKRAGTWDEMIPQVNYEVYVATQGTLRFLDLYREAQTELAGVKRNLEVERKTYKGIFAALLNPEQFARFEVMLKELVTRLKA